MASPPAYPAARIAALRIHPHFVRHLGCFDGTGLLPDVETIEALIDAAFWASLRREELRTPRISLAYVEPALLGAPMTFEHPVALASPALTRLGPAVERPGIHLCVRTIDGQLYVWGAARALPRYCFVLEVIEPGLLIIKHSRGDETGKFVNVAVLQGDEIKVIDQTRIIAPSIRPEDASPESVSVLMRLAVSMRDHGRGGTMLVVPASSEKWRESILHPLTYSVAPAFLGLRKLMEEDVSERSTTRWQEVMRRAVIGFAGLTAVDGATIITDAYELLAFGAKIIRPPKHPQVVGVMLAEPVEDGNSMLVEPSHVGGTRHLSAAQFAQDQRDAVSLVASQDGRFTVFHWSESDQTVIASRIETLLM